MATPLIESEGDHSSDEDFSPGHLVIDMEGMGGVSPGLTHLVSDLKTIDRQIFTPLVTPTPEKGSPQVQSPIVNRGISSEDTFKGLTFVGRMDTGTHPSDVPDTLCLYSYHWGPTHIDIITRRTGQSLVPVKNVYGRVVPGLTRNAVSNRIPKIGAKTVALPDSHISTLKKLQLPITARSHYLVINDFVRLCCYYKKTPPTNLINFAQIFSSDNPAEILKTFNAEKPVAQTTLPPPIQQLPNGMIKAEPLFNQSEISLMSPGQLNASLANSVGEVLQYATPYPLWNTLQPSLSQTPPTPSPSKSHNDGTMSPTAGSEFHSIVLPDGTQLALVIQNSSHYLLNSELSYLLPQANQNVIGPLRSLLNIPLEYASRPNMNALKEVGVIGVKACRSIVYKVEDVIKMFGHFRIPPPRFLHEISNGKIPRGVVDMIPVAQATPPVSQPMTTPISADMMSPSGVRISLGGPRAERRNSHTGQPPLDDQNLEYDYLPWGGSDKSITLLKQPVGEPYVAIAELVDKIFTQRSQVSLQKRTKLGVTTVPATSLQIHALRARGSIDPSSGYSKLVSLSGVVLLAREAGIFVPHNVTQECQSHLTVPLDTLLSAQAPPTPIKKHVNRGSPSLHPSDSAPPPPPPPVVDDSPHLLNKPSMSGLPYLRDEIRNHPDVILPAKLGLRSAEGILYQVVWGKSKIVVFTSARGINYVGLYQIYDVLFKNLVSRMNFKMRMRKLGIKSIRAPPTIRLSLIKLGALPTSSPVCGLLRISEMDRLVRSYSMTPPTVFHDLFLSKRQDNQMRTDDYKNFCNPPGGVVKRPVLSQHSMELVPHLSSSDAFKGRPDDSLVVSLPRALVVVDHPQSQLVLSPHSHTAEPHSQPYHAFLNHPSKSNYQKTSVLQNLAKKISQKNRKLAASSVTTSTRECPSCGRVYPIAKKRCEACKVYLVGRPCPSCSAINYSRCTQCTSCGHPLDPSSMKLLRESGANNRFKEQEAMQDGDTYNTPTNAPPHFSSHAYSDNNDDTKLSDNSDSDSNSPLQSSSFGAPPIRTAVLKKLFPDHQPSSSSTINGSSGSSGAVTTRTVFTGTVGSTRTCLECDAINSKMAKKCQQCRAPLQGRPCPRCSRPNHSHSVECYKCEAPLPPTATKWVVGGRIIRTSNETSVVSGMTSAELNKEVSRRAPITCIRCERMRDKGRFKCGRCGDLYSLSPLLDSNGKIIKKKKNDHNHSNTSRDSAKLPSEDLESLSHNLYLLGVGKELIPTLTEKEQEYWKLLTPAEQEMEVVDEEYTKLATLISTQEVQLSDTQAHLDALIVQVERLNNELNVCNQMETEANETITTMPDEIRKLEEQIFAINHLISPSV